MRWRFGYLTAAVVFMGTACAQPITNIPIPLAIAQCATMTPANGACQPAAAGPNAGIWTFHGQQGVGVWTQPQLIASLAVKRFDTGAVVIRRTDPSGLVTIYQGAVDGNMISGKATWNFRGQNFVAGWYAHIGTPQEQQALAQQQQQALQTAQAAQQQQNQAEMLGLGALIMGLTNAAATTPDSDSGGSASDNGRSDLARLQHQLNTEANQSYIEQHGGVSGPYMR